MKRFLFGLALIVLLPFQAFGFGEIFKIETTGTEYCGDFDFTKFNPNNNVDLWVRVVSASELTVSLTPNFAAGTSFPMTGKTYLTTATAAAFINSAFSLWMIPSLRFKAAHGSIETLAQLRV